MYAIIIAVSLQFIHLRKKERYSYSLLLPNEWNFFWIQDSTCSEKYYKSGTRSSQITVATFIAKMLKCQNKAKIEEKDHHHPTSKENVARAATASSTGTAIIVSSQSPFPPKPSHTNLTKPRPPNPAPRTTSLRTTSFLPFFFWICGNVTQWNEM